MTGFSKNRARPQKVESRKISDVGRAMIGVRPIVTEILYEKMIRKLADRLRQLFRLLEGVSEFEEASFEKVFRIRRKFKEWIHDFDPRSYWRRGLGRPYQTRPRG